VTCQIILTKLRKLLNLPIQIFLWISNLLKLVFVHSLTVGNNWW